MIITFKALEIGTGDAFLLENNGWRCLYDAGASKSKIVSLLKKKGINHINLAICSHNDKDHANGFLGIFESNIQIDEIWLPGNWCSIINYVKEHRLKIFWELERGMIEDCENESFNDEFNDSFYDEREPISIECFDEELGLLSEYVEYIYESYFPYYYRYHIPYKLYINLERILKIASKAYDSGCKIRWFEPKDQSVINSIDYGFTALNSAELVRVKRIKDVSGFVKLLSLTESNKYSLVFEYAKGDVPIVRFSADSDCINQSVFPYAKNIIVTAPHHGSEANLNVYNHIGGDKIIWVRSDRKSRMRPCATFKQQHTKYCLACCNKNIISELHFEYDELQMKWICKNGTVCNC